MTTGPQIRSVAWEARPCGFDASFFETCLTTSTTVEKVNSDKNIPEFEYPDEPFDENELVTNDAVGGEPVNPTGHYAGPEGSEPLEATPEYEEHAPNSEDGPTDLDGQ